MLPKICSFSLQNLFEHFAFKVRPANCDAPEAEDEGEISVGPESVNRKKLSTSRWSQAVVCAARPVRCPWRWTWGGQPLSRQACPTLNQKFWWNKKGHTLLVEEKVDTAYHLLCMLMLMMRLVCDMCYRYKVSLLFWYGFLCICLYPHCNITLNNALKKPKYPALINVSAILPHLLEQTRLSQRGLLGSA